MVMQCEDKSNVPAPLAPPRHDTSRGGRPEEPRVSVLMLTLNHEAFIAQAVESVLAQVTDFRFELVIGDDGSTDRTSGILAEFQARHRHRIRVCRPPARSGIFMNFTQTFLRCRGRYIALLEGDDWWTSTSKLQLQADYLDRHPECPLVFHRVRAIDTAGARVFRMPSECPARLPIEELLKDNVIPTCSVMFRASALESIPFWCAALSVVDWPLFLLLTRRAPAHFLDRTMAAYRLHPRGFWTQRPPEARSQAIIEVLEAVRRHLEPRHGPAIRRRIAEAYAHIAWCHEEANRLPGAVAAAWNAASGCCNWRHAKELVRLVLKWASAWAPQNSCTPKRAVRPV